MQIKFLWVGKTKSMSLKSLVSDYQERVGHLVSCEVLEVRDPSKGRSFPAAELIEEEAKALARHVPASGCLVVLDERGTEFTSAAFARWLEAEQNTGVRNMTFVIGGPEGLSRMLCSRARLILSMGKMTWTHEMCRVLLMEQVYRALCILRNIPYHKGVI
jgi:23S rRNA (pseudouridine1915-N3)-methyltransferase